MLENAEQGIRSDLSASVRELARIQRESGATTAMDSTDSGLNETSLNRLERTNRQQEIEWAQQLLQELVVVKAAWRWRYELANKQADLSLLHERQEALTSSVQRISAMEQALAVRIDERRDEILAVRKQLLAGTANSSNILESHTKELDRTVAFLSA